MAQTLISSTLSGKAVYSDSAAAVHFTSVNMRKHAHLGGGKHPPTLGYLHILNCHFLSIFGVADCGRNLATFLNLSLAENRVFLREEMQR